MKKKTAAKKQAPKRKPAPKKKRATKKSSKKPAKSSSKKPAPASAFDRAFPPVLSALHELTFDFDQGYDFEPLEEFQSAAENQSWIRAWTGNQELSGAEYRVFGQDGTGGYAAFWLVRPGVELVAQPIVFFGSEGSLGVVARNLDEYLWVLAGGVGPMEATEYGADGKAKNDEFTAFALEHAPAAKTTAKKAIAAARKEFPKFEKYVRDSVTYR